MLRRLSILLILLVIMFGCAKKSTELNVSHVLSLAATVPVVGNPVDISASGNRLFVAQDWGGFSEVNLTDYTRKQFTSLPSDGGPVVALERVVKVSYVGPQNRVFLNDINGTDTIQFGNTSNPDTTKLVGFIAGGSQNIKQIKFQELDGTIIEGAFCLDNQVNYGTYNGTTWSGFTKIYTSIAPVSGFDFAGDYICLATGLRGLQIFNRATRVLVGSIYLPGQALRVKVVGNYAYVACRQEGLQIVDITNPASPVIRGSFDTSGYASNVDVWNNLALVSSGSGGFYLLDVSNPANPVLKDTVTSCGYVNSAVFNDGKIIVAGRDQGILVYNINE